MQSVYYRQRVWHPRHGAGVIVEIVYDSRRGTGGASIVEVLAHFDSETQPRAVCIDDLREESSNDGGLKG